MKNYAYCDYSDNSNNNRLKSKKLNKFCKEKEVVKIISNQFQKKFREVNKKCEEEKYNEIIKYFNKDKNTLKHLLICLKEIYKKEKDKNPNFILTLCGSSSAGNENIKSLE